MPAVNFPSSPVLDQEHTVGDATWKWDGARWARLSGVNPDAVINPSTSTDNAARFVIPSLPHRADQFFCFEAVAAMLQLPEGHTMDGNKLQRIVTSIYGVSK